METAHKTDEEKKEHFDSDEVLDQKVTQLAEWIKASKHFIAFTGAGISTSTGIPDYRSGINTVLPTGPGAWEKAATGNKSKGKFRKAIASALPSPCHMALVKLSEAGLLKYIISQNVDGLHRKSGIPAEKIAEVHGNTNVEICKNKACKRQYLRDFRVRTAQKVHDHKTGRMCESCGKEMYDTIINFGENLPEKELTNGFEHGGKADLCIALGSSLRVTPAADMPHETVKNGGRLVIVNLQSTPLDKYAFRINGLIDDVMARLMVKLDLAIPAFTLNRRVMIMKYLKRPIQKGKVELVIRGVDEKGDPYSLFKSVQSTFSSAKEVINKESEPVRLSPASASLDKGNVKIQMSFQGHYGEPDLSIDVALESLKLNVPVYYLMTFDPIEKKWIECKPLVIKK